MNGSWARQESSTQDRIVGAILVLPSAAVLALARWLTPDPAGVGTHQQLGLGACTMLSHLGVPCPMCGMTTSFSLFAHGDVVAAVLNQPFSLVLFCTTLWLFGLGLMDLLSPAGRWRRLTDRVLRNELLVAVCLLAGLVGGWLFKWWRLSAAV